MLQSIQETADPFGQFRCRRRTRRFAGIPRLIDPHVARVRAWSAPWVRENTRLAALAAVCRYALLPFLATRLALVLVGLLANFYILPLMGRNLTDRPLAVNTHLPNALWLMWQHFDSGFYLGLATVGYGPVTSLRHASGWAFYPLYPMLVHVVGGLLGGRAAAYGIAGVLVANAAAVVAVILLYKLVVREFGVRIASRTVLYLAVFPTSFFLSAVYAESLFLACSVACIYCARSRRWWLAGLCGGLAALARAPGIVLVVPLAWEWWQAMSDDYAPLPYLGGARPLRRAQILLSSRVRGPWLALRDPRARRSLPALALVPAGTLSFLLYALVRTGDFLASPRNEYLHWGRRPSLPWNVLADALLHPLAANPREWNFWSFNILITLLFLGAALWSFRWLRASYALYTLLMVLVPLSSSRINSIGRYDLVIFPVLILLALWSGGETRHVRHSIVVGLGASLQAVFMIFFVLGLPAIA